MSVCICRVRVCVYVCVCVDCISVGGMHHVYTLQRNSKTNTQ